MKIRRSDCVVLFVIVGMIGGVAGAQAAPEKAGSEALSQAQVLVFDQMPANKTASGGESRNLLHGALATGETVSLHESVLPPGKVSGPPHVIQHSEFILVREGAVIFEHGDKAEKAGPGDVIYVAMGTMHRVKNVGEIPAKYVVVAIGGDTKK